LQNKFFAISKPPIHSQFHYKWIGHDSIFPFARDGSTNRFNLPVKQYRVYFRPMVEAGVRAIAIFYKITHTLKVSWHYQMFFRTEKKMRKKEREREFISLKTGFAIGERFVGPPVCDNLSNRWTFFVARGPSFILSLKRSLASSFQSNAFFFSYSLY